MSGVLITGGTSGIGFALAKVFAANEYEVTITSSNQNNLEKAQSSLMKEYPVGINIIKQDLSQLGGAKSLYDAVKASDIQVDVLVNNAGYGLVGRTEDIDYQEDENMMVLNTINLVGLCKLFLPDMYLKGHGKILNVSSTGAFQPGPYTSTYFASKAFVLNYSRAIRYEAKKHGVHICTLCPGATNTNFFIREGSEAPEGSMTADAVAEYAYKQLIRNKAILIPGLLNRAMQLLPMEIKMVSVAKMKYKQLRARVGDP